MTWIDCMWKLFWVEKFHLAMTFQKPHYQHTHQSNWHSNTRRSNWLMIWWTLFAAQMELKAKKAPQDGEKLVDCHKSITWLKNGLKGNAKTFFGFNEKKVLYFCVHIQIASSVKNLRSIVYLWSCKKCDAFFINFCE